MNNAVKPTLIDRFNRQVDYVRLSVTDRCDFRCVYCMAEDMTFAPRAEILTLEELGLIAQAFVELGVKKIRLTGGEPLVRQNVMSLVDHIGQLDDLNELTLTTNGSQLSKQSKALYNGGVKRINISIDSLKPERFKTITRTGDLETVLQGIDAAIATGFKRIKLNAVILKGRNEDEIIDLVNFARDKNVDISFIEEMPLGLIDEHNRALSFCSSDEIRETVSAHYPLTSSDETTGGPSHYYTMADSDSRIGFISPHSHNFCHLCNRVRVTVEGRLLLCLGNEHSADLRAVLRANPGAIEPLKDAIIAAMDLKPEKHHFNLDEEPDIVRFMNMTGG
ncbi:GTP 3',8-cyclase MoaA [Oceanicoccus sagamiensis]|uniref:GTP 3',8-cyclase n=1 Tax=Oceanicoccus sagamiensis TaxID=716816 RepID=A0A1X9N7H2_9GAMM|nr:GTP 3',8-cyclase MoaA [Oceanicoccus sagamiensis]ARN73636.1 cyclic pyranopterin phosphate synthase MoaA [Oceanicoccus sagamiensis]